MTVQRERKAVVYDLPTDPTPLEELLRKPTRLTSEGHPTLPAGVPEKVLEIFGGQSLDARRTDWPTWLAAWRRRECPVCGQPGCSFWTDYGL